MNPDKGWASKQSRDVTPPPPPPPSVHCVSPFFDYTHTHSHVSPFFSFDYTQGWITLVILGSSSWVHQCVLSKYKQSNTKTHTQLQIVLTPISTMRVNTFLPGDFLDWCCPELLVHKTLELLVNCKYLWKRLLVSVQYFDFEYILK